MQGGDADEFIDFMNDGKLPSGTRAMCTVFRG